MSGSQRPTEAQEARLIEMVDWAREFLACEVEGQYTSDAALHLAMFMLSQAPPAYTVKPSELPDIIP